MITLFLFFVLGPVLGFAGICAFTLISQCLWFGINADCKDFKTALRNVPKTFRANKLASWATIGVEVALLLLISPLLGYALTLSTIGSLLLLATFSACAEDGDFRHRVWSSLNLIWDLVALRIERLRGTKSGARFSAPVVKETPRASCSSRSVSVPSAATAPAPRRVAVTRDPDAELLNELLGQVQKLQRWTVRPDAEKKQITELVAATAAAEAALRTAAGQLKDGTVDWNGITAHVTALKGHNLPAEVSATLDKLVADRAAAVAAKRGELGGLAGTLDGSRSALDALVTKPQLSPEEALAAAQTALNEAAELTAPAAETAAPADK